MSRSVIADGAAPPTEPAIGFDALFASAAADCDLPPFPAVAARAMALTRDADGSMEEMARVIGQDPALAARLLRLAHSPMFTRREPPRTLLDAIRLVGITNLRQLVVVASAGLLYRSPKKDLVAEALWKHAVVTAQAADELAALAGQPRGGNAFLAGLLHDVGKLVFHMAQPAEFATLGAADDEAEKALFKRSHALVSGALAFRWELGRDISEAILLHHDRPVPAGLAADVASADWIAHRIGCGSVEGDVPEPPDADLAQLEAVAERVARNLENDDSMLS